MKRAAGAAIALTLLTAGPALGHTYRGETVKGGTISMRVGSDDSTVIRLRAERELSCRKGKFRSFRQGAFRQRSTFVRRSGGVFRGSKRTRGISGSLVRLGRFSIRFRISESRARGVFRERVRLRGGTRCTSGRVRFSIPLIDTND